MFKLFLFISLFSGSLFADCVSHYRKRAAFKAERYRADKNPYNKKKAEYAQEQADILEKLVSGKIDQKLDQQIFIACTNFFIDPDMPNGEGNADKYCPLGKMLVMHKGFIKFVSGRNASDGYCPRKDISALKKLFGGDKKYEPRDYIFNLNKEFEVYLAKEFF